MPIDKIIGEPLGDKSAPTVGPGYFVHVHNRPLRPFWPLALGWLIAYKQFTPPPQEHKSTIRGLYVIMSTMTDALSQMWPVTPLK